MATAKGLARVAEINKAVGTKGYSMAPRTSSGSSSSPSYPQNYVSTNPHDAPGYKPELDPTSSAYGKNISTTTPPITSATPPITSAPTIDTSRPSPATVQVQPYTKPDLSLGQAVAGKGSALTSAEMATPQTLDEYTSRYNQGLANIKATGRPAPDSQGQSSDMIQGALPGQRQESPAISNFFNPENPVIQDSTSRLMEWLNPEADRQMINESIKQLSADRAELAGMKTELMSINRIMEGSEGDIRGEIQAAGGIGTNSQILALTISRNSTLLKKAQLISDQIQSQTDLVNSDISLIGDLKQMAAQQFNQRMSLLQYQQTNNMNMYNAFKDNVNAIQKTAGWAGVLAAYQGDPNQMAFVDSLFGGAGSVQRLASIPPPPLTEMEQADLAYKKAQTANIYSEIAQRNEDNTIMVDTQGKVMVKPTEAMKINKELTSSDAYKAVRKAQDSLQFLTQFEDKFNKTGATSAVFSPRQNADLKAKYNTAILNLKEFFNLGVLNGPDEAILRSVLPDPTNRSAILPIITGGIYKPSAGTQAGISNMKTMIEATLDDRYKSISSQYSDYSPQSVNSLNDLNRIYIEQKSKLNPKIQQMMKENPELTFEDVITIISQ